MVFLTGCSKGMMLCCIRGHSGPGLQVHITSVSSKTRTIISRAQGYGLPSLPSSFRVKHMTDLLSSEPRSSRRDAPEVVRNGSEGRMQDWSLGNRGTTQIVKATFARAEGSQIWIIFFFISVIVLRRSGIGSESRLVKSTRNCKSDKHRGTRHSERKIARAE